MHALDIVTDSWLDSLQYSHQFLMNTFLSLCAFVTSDKCAWFLDTTFAHILTMTLHPGGSAVNDRTTSHFS